MEPEIGTRVVVKPRNGLQVQYEEVHGRWLPVEGQSVIWNPWWHSRYRDGSIEIVQEEEQD